MSTAAARPVAAADFERGRPLVLVGGHSLARELDPSLVDTVRLETLEGPFDAPLRLASSRRYLALISEVPFGIEKSVGWLDEVRRTRPRIPVLLCGAMRDARAADAVRQRGAELAFRPDLVGPARGFVRRLIALRARTTIRMQEVVEAIALRYDLSPRERELLELLADGVHRGRLARALGVSENTTKTLVRRVLVKTSEVSIDALGRGILQEALEREATAALEAVERGERRATMEECCR